MIKLILEIVDNSTVNLLKVEKTSFQAFFPPTTLCRTEYDEKELTLSRIPLIKDLHMLSSNTAQLHNTWIFQE